jgi:hypoxanthine phosphoribosyltransferase
MTEKRLLFSRAMINERIDALAGEIDAHYASIQEPVVLVCVLKGAFMFFADLVRRLTIQPELEFVRMASYGHGTTRGETICFSKDVELDLDGRHVLIVEDIVDTGHTAAYLLNAFARRNPASLRICACIHKSGRREVDLPVDFHAFSLQQGFVVGYGLDCAEQYRQLEAIYELVE